MSEVIKTKVSKAVAREFKKKAMEQYGYKKGAVSQALDNLIEGYISRQKPDWGALKGSLRSELASVELQHKALRESD